ncbi:MAG: cysteine--tRNA ligase [Candidatus Pacebacteria bacterium]|nr:cysteine--tRNA ligase [Candidatus Paceibacterota bacterium]MDD5356754.1 cysteine--tRNA ligase [Candidatus Paceibacterota bacterium]
MALTLFDTLSGEKKEFTPLSAPEVTMYNCGPTVYNYLHIGNLRTFVTNDILRRTLEWNNYEVKQVMNITDVDDKTIRGAQAEKESLGDFTKKYEGFFLEDIKALNIEMPWNMPHATEYITQIISLIQKLIASGAGYKTDDGIYFDVTKAKNYGALARLEKRTETKSRIAKDEYDKENPSDFALWKFHKEEDGDVKWPASFGEGRPGWHIECSAMSQALLGDTIDIHTGGIDLIFPHHTNEIAQSETATEKHPFVRYWLHGAFLNVAEGKMAKSAGNFIRLRDLKEKGIHPLSYRYFLLGAHYRSPLNFSYDAILGAQTTLENIVREIKMFSQEGTAGKILSSYRKDFSGAIDDDLNIPQTLAILHALLSSKEKPEDKLATIIEFDKVLGLNLVGLAKEMKNIPKEILAINEKREIARKEKDWKKSDELRAEIEKAGYKVLDGAKETTIERSLSSLLTESI